MTEAQAIETIYETWLAAWQAQHPDTPTAFGNEEFTPPPAPSSWCRVTVRHTVSVQATTGPIRQYERRGRVVVQLFGEVNQGDAPLAALAGDARSIFEGQSLYVTPGDFVALLAGTTTDGPTGGDGKPTDGRWAMRSVSFPFWYREQR